tara:strand:+ start:142 stop:450 length:309 start_codon:yes stop_codon:yes gene_type:complete
MKLKLDWEYFIKRRKIKIKDFIRYYNIESEDSLKETLNEIGVNMPKSKKDIDFLLSFYPDEKNKHPDDKNAKKNIKKTRTPRKNTVSRKSTRSRKTSGKSIK